MDIGSRLREIRNDRGLSQSRFAGELSVHTRSYTSYELGQRSLPQALLLAINDMGYDIVWLLTGNGNMKLSGLVSGAEASYDVEKRIPLISDLQKAFGDKKIPDPALVRESVLRPEFCKDPLCYAVRVSALKDQELSPLFGPGDILIVSPLETIFPRDKVIVNISDEIFFRIVHFNDTDICLTDIGSKKPLCEAVPGEILFMHKIIGTNL